MPDLITDDTLDTYNSYVTIPEVDAQVRLFEGVYGTTTVDKWLALAPDLKEGLILDATGQFNNKRFLGTLIDTVLTSMQFPRSGLKHPNGVDIDSTAVPDFVKKYIAERALELAVVTQKISSLDLAVAASSLKLGPLQKTNDTSRRAREKKLSQYRSYAHIRPYIVPMSGVIRA